MWAHIIVLGEAHLRRALKSYARYYNDVRTHRSLDKDAPVSRPVQRTGSIKSLSVLADSIITTPGFRSYAGATGGRGVLPVRFPFHRCIGETLMEIRTVNNLPSAAAHEDAVRCLLAIELS